MKTPCRDWLTFSSSAASSLAVLHFAFLPASVPASPERVRVSQLWFFPQVSLFRPLWLRVSQAPVVEEAQRPPSLSFLSRAVQQASVLRPAPLLWPPGHGAVPVEVEEAAAQTASGTSASRCASVACRRAAA